MTKTILITGATGNLGSATLDKCLQEGHMVIAIVLPGRGLEPKNNLHIYEANLADEQSVGKVMDVITSKHQAVDAAVLTVGGFAMGAIPSTSSADIQKMLSLNFDSAYHVVRPLLSQMIKQRNGRMVFVGAKPALEPAAGKNTVAYALSKTLVFKLSELVNAEGFEKNVKSSVIVPEIIDTAANRKDMPHADFSKWTKPPAIARIIHDFIVGLRDEPIIKLYN